jgi:hypothetical protein
MKKLIYTAALLLLSACASSQPGTQGPSETLDIRVNNNLVPPVLLTISLVPSSGPERNLGEAFSSRVTDFRYNGLAPRGQYRLLARATDNRAMASDYIVLDGVQAIEWSLQTNRVTILRTRNDN